MSKFSKTIKLAVLGLAASASAAFAAAPGPVAKAVSACCEAMGIACDMGCC